MDLDDIPIRTVGRPASQLSVEVIGEVEEADLLRLDAPRPTGQAVRIKEFRDRHHSVARLLASGHAPWEVAAITGYDKSRVSILQADPAFQELLAHYRDCDHARTADLGAMVKDVAATAVSRLADRLESDELIEFADLSKAAKDLLDRAGHGPKSTKDVNINVGLADRIEQARQRALAAKAPPMIELEAAE